MSDKATAPPTRPPAPSPTGITAEDKKILAADILAILEDIINHNNFRLLSDGSRAAIQAIHMTITEAPIIEDHTKKWLHEMHGHVHHLGQKKGPFWTFEHLL